MMLDYNLNVVIRRPAPGADGPPWTMEVYTRALRITARRRVPVGGEPAIRQDTVFLVPPPAIPAPGDLLSCDGAEYELAAVRECRDLDGALVCCRCEVAV